MLTNVLKYFQRKPAVDLLDETAGADCRATRIINETVNYNLDRELDKHKNKLSYYSKATAEYFIPLDFNYIVSITITSKNRVPEWNKSIATDVERFFFKPIVYNNWSFVLYPAYQNDMVLHYHGIAFYKGDPLLFQTRRKKMQYSLTKCIGFTTVKHCRSTIKSKIVNGANEINNIINYQIMNGDNYGGFDESFILPITNSIKIYRNN